MLFLVCIKFATKLKISEMKRVWYCLYISVKEYEAEIEADDKIRRALYFRHKGEQELIRENNYRIFIEDPRFRMPGILECYQSFDHINDNNDVF